MQIVLTHVQRLVLRRLAAIDGAATFVQIVPNATAIVRRQYRVALDFLVANDFVGVANVDPGRTTTLSYFITTLGRRELYPRASRESQ